MTLLTGWIPDLPDPRDWRFEESMIAGSRPIASAGDIDYRRFDVPRVQLGNSCVGHAIVAAAALCMAIRGKPIAFPSAQFAWTGARLLAKPPGGLQNTGCSARNAMIWLRDRGMVAETRWPENGENLNAIPPLDVWQEGDAAQLEAFYRIAHGPGASSLVLAALERGYCPAFAMLVDDAWAQVGSKVYDGPGGKVHGGHMMVVVAYIPSLDAFVVRNTWGPDWGIGGYGLISRRAFDLMARDILVVSAAPEVR